MPTLGEIASLLGLPEPVESARSITGIATLAEARPSEISFITSEKYLKQFETTAAGAVLLPATLAVPARPTIALLQIADPMAAVEKLLRLFAPPIQRPPVGGEKGERIAGSARIGESASICAGVTIGERTTIGKNCQLHTGVVIGDDVQIGDDCTIFPNVVIRERISIGNRVTIQAGSVIGTDGFGYRWDGKQHVKIPQIGTVMIEDDVEIGSCTCIDRGKFSATRIGRGSKIDNLVQIAHNVQIGPFCMIVSQVGIAGSTVLGAGVVMGGQSGAADNLSIAAGTIVAGRGALTKSVTEKCILGGYPAMPHRDEMKQQVHLRRLPELEKQVKALAAEVERLKAK